MYRYGLRVSLKEESRVYKDFCVLKNTNKQWSDVLDDVYFFNANELKFVSNTLVLKFKALLPGMLFIKAKMNATIASEILKVDGVVDFIRDRGVAKVHPLGPEEARKMQLAMNAMSIKPSVHPSLLGLCKGDLVYVSTGYYSGWFGELVEENKGKLKVTHNAASI